MARRLKEEPARHRERIASAAQRLFSKQGIEASTMDEIAKEAGYSKATLYVYFKNKEEIVGCLIRHSMEILVGRLRKVADEIEGIYEQYFAFCEELVRYQEEFPFYFELALGEIQLDFEIADVLGNKKAAYELGEQANEVVGRFLRQGMEEGVLRPDLQVLPTVFLFWGSLSGLILLAVKKETYIQRTMNLTKQEFLEQGFKSLFRLVSAEVGSNER